jgi:hypothetical protein
MRRVVLVLVCVAMVGGVGARGKRVEAASSQNQARPEYPCFKHHGRMSSGSNGIPTRIWLIGTNRVVAVGGRYTLPENGDRYLDPTTPDYSYIYGDFELCPEEPDVAGTMRHVLLVGAENARC